MVLTQRHIDQWNKIESPEIHPCTYGHLIFAKEARIYNGGKTISLKSGAGKTGQLHAKNEIRILPNVMHKDMDYSKWIKSLNVRPETIKLL